MEYILYIGVLAGLYAILAQSLNLVLGYGGQAALGQGGLACIGAYTSAVLSLDAGISPWLSTLVAACLGAGAGTVISYPAIRIKGDYLALATFATAVIIYSLSNNWVALTKGPMGLPGIPPYTILGTQLDSPSGYFVLILFVFAITMMTMRRITRSPFGRVLQAIRDDEVAAVILGKNVTAFKIVAFAVSGFFAALAGALYAHYYAFIDPTSFDPMVSITILLMVVLGGMGTLWGPVIGAVLIAIVPEFLRFLDVPGSIAGPLKQMLFGGLLVVLIIARPQGLLGRVGFR